MSTPPEKPLPHPPLHNFALPQLNWSKNHSTNLHRGRRLGESSSQTQSSSMNSAILRFQDSLSLQQPVSPTAANVRSQLPRRSDSRRGRPRERKEESDRSQSSPGFQLRMRKKAEEVVVEDKEKAMADEDEEEKKSWNFRPRKPLRRSQSGNPNIYSYDTIATVPEGISDFPPIAGSSSGMKSTPTKPQKPTFSLTLTPEEIEEDIFAMTGSKPSRKPKRRPKAVQKHLDNIFPGMWLGSVTPDSYNVPDPSKKKGGGFMSLENLLYFARNFPKSFQDLLRKTEGDRAMWEYPFAVAGVNITFMLIQMLDLEAAKWETLQGE